MRLDVKKWLLLVFGTLVWSLTMVKSGWLYPFGLGFWGPNGHDGVWHLALINSLAKGLPAQPGSFDIPVFAGEGLKNYHIGFDLILAVLHRFLGIDSVTLYFQIVPPILALLIGILTYKLVFLWQKDRAKAYWSTFFVYFGGSLGWILGKGESTFWSQQQISTLINPPFALSLVFILLGTISLLKKKTLLAILFLGPLVQIKAYAAVLVLGGLLVSRHFKVFLGSLAVAAVLIFPFRSSSFPFVWQPFWFLETMMQLTDRVGWVKFGEAMVNYKTGGIWLKAILAYGIAFAIFIFGNLGTRILAIRYPLSAIRSSINIFMYSIIMGGILLPMFFLQAGTPWNTIQFFYYSLFFSGILAGMSFVDIARYFKLQGTFKIYVIEGMLLLFTFPTTIDTLKQYLPVRPPSMISNEELAALSFLSKQPDGVVLTFLFDRAKAKEAESNPPRPLYLYESTAYVSAFSNKPTFLEDQVNLDITGYDWRKRRSEIENWYKEKDHAKAHDFLKENNIKYIYWVKPQKALLGEGQLGVNKIFENNEVNIYKIEQ